MNIESKGNNIYFVQDDLQAGRVDAVNETCSCKDFKEFKTCKHFKFVMEALYTKATMDTTGWTDARIQNAKDKIDRIRKKEIPLPKSMADIPKFQKQISKVSKVPLGLGAKYKEQGLSVHEIIKNLSEMIE